MNWLVIIFFLGTVHSTLSTYNSIGVVCKPGDDIISDPDHCGRFYQCSNGRPYHMNCAPQGLVYNPNTGRCAYSHEHHCHPCHFRKNPEECLSSKHNCSFCFDRTFSSKRCDTAESLSKFQCKNSDPDAELPPINIDPSKTGNGSGNGGNGNGNENKIQPSVVVPIKPGKKRNITFTLQRYSNPLDVYFLMDFSGSMSDDKANVVKLSSELTGKLKDITNDYTLGFGAFVDKPRSPLGGTTDYSFLNKMPLSKSTQGFSQKVQDTKILNGGDGPEGAGDAMFQVIKCTEQIGWRQNTRRLLLMGTDATFHVAGDGRRANPPITTPFDERCHLDRAGYYSQQLNLDYPSLDQIVAASAQNQITTIFAVTRDTFSFYNNLASRMQPSAVGELSRDSSNIVKLVVDKYSEIDSKVQLKYSKEADEVKVKFFSSCSKSSKKEMETTVCDNLAHGEEVSFTIEFDLQKCPKAGTESSVLINPIGLPYFINVTLAYICQLAWD